MTNIVQIILGLIQELNIITRLTRHELDNIYEFKNIKMQKSITLTQSDYTNITKAFFFYLENEKELNLTKKEINSILKTNNKIQ